MRLSGCSVTFANVLGSARLKACSKNTGGTVSSDGIVLLCIGTSEARREDVGACVVGVRLVSDVMDARGVTLSSSPWLCKVEESSWAWPSRPRRAFFSNRSHSGVIARKYDSKSFRRTRGRSAGGTVGNDECAFGGACFLCGLFNTVDIAVNAFRLVREYTSEVNVT